MRHALFLPLALAGLAACADAVTAPEPPTPSASLRASVSAGAGAVVVSDPQLVAWNEGGLMFGPNLPLAELGGGRVVWQDASSGAAAVLGYDLATGARTQYATVDGNFAWPVTEGRWVAWSDQGGTIYLRDVSTGTVRTIGPGAGYTVRISPEGRVAFLEFSAGVGNVAVYDAATGETRVLTHYTPSTAEAARDVDVDGNLVTWSTFTQRSPYTTGIRMLDLATGAEREVVHVNYQAIEAPAVSAGRIAWADNRSGNYDVYVYDVASGTTRQITTDPAGQFNVRISGDYVVWEDTRNSTSHYFPSNDVYLYDLASGTEMPVATGENHQGWPRVDGNRVLWTERANDRWEIRTAVLEPVTLQSLSSAVDRMLASGDIANRGAAESLRAFIAQATRARDAGDAAGERAALERFAAHVQELAGKQVSTAAAGRLQAMAAALLRSLS
jgi:TolB protein